MISGDTHTPFRFKNIQGLKSAIEQLGLNITVSDDLSVLMKSLELGGRIIPNSMCVQPMEGCDGTHKGAPGELTYRRYKRFAEGGAGMLWFEACAVAEAGRANPRQLRLDDDTKADFSKLVSETLSTASESMGSSFKPFTILQLTHSGRYSRPVDAPQPVIAHHDPILDAAMNIPKDYPLVSDDELEKLEDDYAKTAKLAFEAGFDAVDVKACHRYLINELLAARTRKGKYGGSYENRTRFLKNILGKIRAETGRESIITCRLNIYDAHPSPHGWGMPQNGKAGPDLSEPKRLVQELYTLGVRLINITMGNPYFTPHINRPHDKPAEGMGLAEENPLAGVARLIGLTREIQREVPDMLVVGSGYSWLRHFWPNVAAGEIGRKSMGIAGLGRQAFAYPGFAKEIINTGKLTKGHTCITCSSCTQIMRDGGKTGCVPFDSDIYGPIYREGIAASRAKNL